MDNLFGNLSQLNKMATGSSIELEGSDELIENPCSSCLKSNKLTASEFVCKNCREFYCAPCREFHRRFAGLSDHVVLKKSSESLAEIQTKAPKKEKDSLSKACSKHDNQYLTMYCSLHDLVLCPTCVALNHRTCAKLDYIPDLENKFDITTIFLNFQDRLETSIENLEQLQLSKKNDLSGLNDSEKEARTYLQEGIQRMTGLLIELASATENDIANTATEIRNDLIDDVRQIDINIEHLKRQKSDIENSKEMKTSLRFVTLKQGEQKLNEIDGFVHELSSNERCVKIDFIFDPEVKCIERLQKLGNVIQVGEKKDVASETEKVYKISSKSTVNVQLKKEKLCLIVGICQLQDGRLVIADLSNAKLKVVDLNHKTIEFCELDNEPYSVCHVGGKEVAVTIKNTVQFFRISKKPQKTKLLTFSHGCFGLAFQDNFLYITDGRANLFVYNLGGVKIRTLSLDENGKNIFTFADAIALSRDREKIFVADMMKGVAILDRQGKLMSVYSDTQILHACAVCEDGDGNVFVCGNQSDTVVVINRDGKKKIGIILSSDDGLLAPKCLHFDAQASKLFVACEQSSEIQVCDMVLI